MARKQVSETRYNIGEHQKVTHLARGDGTFGQSISLPSAPIELIYCKFIDDKGAEHFIEERADAGDEFCALSGADGRTLKLGANISIPAKTIDQEPNIIVRYLSFGAGWSPDLDAFKTSEQFALQGDAESRHVKSIGTWVETDTDSHFTTAISSQTAGTTAARVDTENLTGMPWNKFWIRRVVFFNTSQESFRLWFSTSDGFDDTDLDLDKLIGHVDIASIHGVQLGSVSPYRWQFPQGNHNMLLSQVSIADAEPAGGFLYIDEDGTNELHVMLENRSPDSDHSAGADKIKIRFYIEPAA